MCFMYTMPSRNDLYPVLLDYGLISPARVFILEDLEKCGRSLTYSFIKMQINLNNLLAACEGTATSNAVSELIS